MGQVLLKSVRKSFGSAEVIPDLSLAIPDGSFTVLVGPSGCGKSTILRMIAGLEDVSSGTIKINDRDVTYREPSQRGIAMVFQSYALYPHMTVAENIGFGMILAKRPKAEINKRVGEAAAILRLEHLLDRKPKQLSGGQRQRVAIGRAITRDPQVFLFDEPLSNLDASLRGQMRVELAELHSKIGATMIYVTHDQVEAMTMADQIVVLNNGRIEQQGMPMELYIAPKTRFVAGFIGAPSMNFFEGSIASQHDCDALGVRPEHIGLRDDDGDLTGRIRHAEQLGSDTIIYVHHDDYGQITVRAEGNRVLDIGSTVHLTLPAEHLHRFRNGFRIQD
ncbi:MAG: ATP-binding cassette domain-containing protein [Albidovulum sp.]|nr:ATP-binding cassette domain-containing protein [Albidovulum sp.]